jgi:hypothetical protein
MLARESNLAGSVSSDSNEILRQPVRDRSAWRRDDLIADRSWLYELNAAEIADIEHALSVAKQRRVPASQLRKADFPLSALGLTLSRITDELENGRGLVVLRGFPVGNHEIGDNELITGGISAHFGELIVQNTKGTMIDHVSDRGLSYDNVAVRGYTTNAELTPHCDSGDIIALLCIQAAKTGGVNGLSSSMSIYNEILRTHPEYLEDLYEGFHYNLRGSGPPGDGLNVTQHRVPTYSYHKGKLSCRFNQKAIKTAEEIAGITPLTQKQKAAIECVSELAKSPELRFDVRLEPGDLLLLNNHVVFHTRTAFTDHDDPAKKRLLLRVWINIDKPRELTAAFADHYNTGPRQGPYVHHSNTGA